MDVQNWNSAVFLDGDFRPALDGGALPVLDKATGAELGVSGLAGAGDVDAAVAGAVKAAREWAGRPATERAALLRRVADLLDASRDEWRELIMRETGSIGGKADYEIGAAISELREAATLVSRPLGEVFPTSHVGRLSYSKRVPLGVVAVITPWNFPLVLAMRVIAPAIALGNSVVLKPSPETPFCGGAVIAELFRRADAIPGLLQVLPGQVDVGEAMVSHPDVAMVHFTGSTGVGRKIAVSAAGSLKKVSLELGGNNALLVLEDADVENAAMLGAWSSFHYQGQTCITAGRHLVHRSVAADYAADLVRRAEAVTVGDTTAEGVNLGPMINRTQFERGRRLLEDAVAAGATVLTGGPGEAPFFHPTVVTGVTTDMDLWNEEIFAPIVPILTFEHDLEAVAVTNDSPYGLVNSVVSADPGRALRVAEALRSGMVHINDATPQDEAMVPFGGVGQSGLGGRSGGDANLHEYTETRWFTVATEPQHYPY